MQKHLKACSARKQLFGVFAIDCRSLALPIRPVGAADVRALVPIEAAPAQRFEDGALALGGASRPIGILDAQDELAAVLAREAVVDQCDVRRPNVRIAGRRRRDARSYRSAQPTSARRLPHSRSTKSTISCSGAPGVKISRTPSSLRRFASSDGIVPPPKKTMSAGIVALQLLDDEREERHVRAGEDREADAVGVFLDRGLHDLLGRLEESGVDDLHARVAQGSRDDLCAAIVAVEAGLSDDDAQRSVVHLLIRA